jgi:hypothetical protein
MRYYLVYSDKSTHCRGPYQNYRHASLKVRGVFLTRKKANESAKEANKAARDRRYEVKSLAITKEKTDA